MIEFKAAHPWEEDSEWKPFGKWWSIPNEKNFAVYDFRIDGVVYRKSTKEFIKAFEQTRLWEKLSG